MKLTDRNRREIRTQLSLYADLDSVLSGSLEKAAANVLALGERWKKRVEANQQLANQYIRFEVEVEHEFDGYDQLHLFGIRLETDEEILKRVKISQQLREAQKLSTAAKKKKREEEERKLYNELKKKYEKNER